MSEEKDSFDLEAFVQALELNPNDPQEVMLTTGRAVTVRKATAAELFIILDMVKSVVKHLDLTTFEGMQDVALKVENPYDLLNLVAGSMDQFFNLVTALCDADKEQIMGRDIDDLVAIAWAEWKVNEHFFTNRLMPMLLKISTEQQSQQLTNETELEDLTEGDNLATAS